MRAFLLVAGSLSALLAATSAFAAPAVPFDPAPECSPADKPAVQLICRDPVLAAAAAELDVALAALGETTDEAGRAAIEAGQTLWQSRRDESCPVGAEDMADAKAAKLRGDCLLRALRQRIAALEMERQSRARPVADLPLTVSGAAGLRLPPIPPRPASAGRPIAMAALVGRWAKAGPGDRPAIVDDCRNAYLEIGRDLAVQAVDPRLPMFPIEGTLPAGGDPVKGVALSASVQGDAPNGEPATAATLRLVAGDAPRLDRLVLRLEAPANFAAELVRCR